MHAETVDLALDYLESDDAAGEMAYDEAELSDEGIRERLRRWSVIGRIIGLLHPLPMPANVPPDYTPRPPITAPAEQRKSNGKSRQRPPNEASELLDHFGHVAAEAESGEEADDAIAALLPLARMLAGHAGAMAMRQAGPVLNRAMHDAGRILRGDPRTRPLVRALPAVARRTASTLRQATTRGTPATPAAARDALLRAFLSILGDPAAAHRVAGHARTRPCRHCGQAGRAPAHHARPCGCRHHGS